MLTQVSTDIPVASLRRVKPRAGSPRDVNLFGVGCGRQESTWVAAPNALAPSGRQARGNAGACFGSLTNQSLLEGYRAFTEANDGSMCLAMEYGGEKSLNDLIEERNAERLGPFPAATIFKVALSMARGLKVCLTLTVAVLCGIVYTGDTGKINEFGV